MRLTHAGMSALAVLSVFFAGAAAGGEVVDVNSLNYGMRYCPAPWCDNKEFIDTHFGIDAKTGKVTKYVGGDHPYQEDVTTDGQEVVLYTSPPISVENRYVPPAASVAMPPSYAPAPGPSYAPAYIPAPAYNPAPAYAPTPAYVPAPSYASAPAYPPPAYAPASGSAYASRPAYARTNPAGTGQNRPGASPARVAPARKHPETRETAAKSDARKPWWKAILR